VRQPPGYNPAMPDLTIPASAPAAAGPGIKAYLATPSGDGPWPGVVVIHDVFGLTRVARAHADHLARYGYIALAPDLYSRGGRLRCVRATFRSLARGRGQSYDAIEAARAWLARRGDSTGAVGIIGFCMGGGFALMTANQGFAAAAANYGPLPKDLDAALTGACPIVGSYGGKDMSLKGAVARLETALTERDIPHDLKEYPDAGHSFMDEFPIGPLAPVARVAGFGYDGPSAADAWRRIEAFFAEHLRTGA
jgi:carboxymethylenebutenolidase